MTLIHYKIWKYNTKISHWLYFMNENSDDLEHLSQTNKKLDVIAITERINKNVSLTNN